MFAVAAIPLLWVIVGRITGVRIQRNTRTRVNRAVTMSHVVVASKATKAFKRLLDTRRAEGSGHPLRQRLLDADAQEADGGGEAVMLSTLSEAPEEEGEGEEEEGVVEEEAVVNEDQLEEEREEDHEQEGQAESRRGPGLSARGEDVYTADRRRGSSIPSDVRRRGWMTEGERESFSQPAQAHLDDEDSL